MGVWQPKTNCFHVSSYFHGVFMDKPSLREGPHQRSANLTYPSHRMPCKPPDVANDRASWRLRHLISARCRRNRFKVILDDTNIKNHWRIHWNWYNSVVGDCLFLALFQMNWVFIASTTAPRRISGQPLCALERRCSEPQRKLDTAGAVACLSASELNMSMDSKSSFRSLACCSGRFPKLNHQETAS